jgi:hypothetical protein
MAKKKKKVQKRKKDITPLDMANTVVVTAVGVETLRLVGATGASL